MRKTAEEIIDETVEFYSKNPRAKSDGGYCLYKTLDGLQCAHSRCLRDEVIDEVNEFAKRSKRAKQVIDEFTDSIHKEEYQGHSGDFWDAIQSLHDNNCNWNQAQSGLSEDGVLYVATLKETYKTVVSNES